MLGADNPGGDGMRTILSIDHDAKACEVSHTGEGRAVA